MHKPLNFRNHRLMLTGIPDGLHYCWSPHPTNPIHTKVLLTDLRGLFAGQLIQKRVNCTDCKFQRLQIFLNFLSSLRLPWLRLNRGVHHRYKLVRFYNLETLLQYNRQYLKFHKVLLPCLKVRK